MDETEGECRTCGQPRILTAGHCIGCNRARGGRVRECAGCGAIKQIKARRLCNACYLFLKRQRQRLIPCAGCGRDGQSLKAAGLCSSCYDRRAA